MTAAEIIGRDIPRDKSGDPCAACGQKKELRELTGVAGRLLMLCTDFQGCCKRYRSGLAPGGYAQMLRRGLRP